MPTPPTRVLDKALSLLSIIVADGGARSVSALADEAGLPSATAHRIVATCEERGFVTRIGRGRFLAGPALLELAGGASLNRLLEALGRQELTTLARETGMTAHLGVFEDDMVTYLVKAGRESAGLFTREGMQLEAYCSGVGKVLLAHLPERARELYLDGGPFVALTPQTIVDVDHLRAELMKVRAQGYAIDDGEVAPGLRCLAVPIRDRAGGAIAAISISAPRGARTSGLESRLERLLAASRALEGRLFREPTR